MIYAQIKNGVIINTIVLNDASRETEFAVGFDSLIRVDNLTPEPGIGWLYEDEIFSAPPPVDEEVTE